MIFSILVNRTSPHSYSVHNSFQNCSKYQHDLDTKLPYTIIIRCSNAKEDVTDIHLKLKSDNNITYNNFFIIMPSDQRLLGILPFYGDFFIFSNIFKHLKKPDRKDFSPLSGLLFSQPSCIFSQLFSLTNRSEEFHLLFYCSLDSFEARI